MYADPHPQSFCSELLLWQSAVDETENTTSIVDAESGIPMSLMLPPETLPMPTFGAGAGAEGGGDNGRNGGNGNVDGVNDVGGPGGDIDFASIGRGAPSSSSSSSSSSGGGSARGSLTKLATSARPMKSASARLSLGNKRASATDLQNARRKQSSKHVALAVAAEAKAAGLDIDVDVSGMEASSGSNSVQAAQFRLFEAKLVALIQAEKQSVYEQHGG
jgi:hypothetical protein